MGIRPDLPTRGTSSSPERASVADGERRRRRAALRSPVLALVLASASASACVANPFYAAPEVDASASDADTEGSTSSAGSASATASTTAMTTGVTSVGTAETSGPMGYCGDGVVNGPEECDDGANNGAGKPCNGKCLYNVCGDGELGPGEACDEGMNNGPGSTCNALCQVNVCGDGDLGPGEECDDGMANGPGSACNALCHLNVCGDGDQGPAEACDDGNDVELDGCESDCTASMPDDIMGLVLWLRADEGVMVANNQVVKWADQSGEGNDAINGVEQPGPVYPSKSGQLNGVDVVRFDGPHPLGMRLALPDVMGETAFAVAQSFDYGDNDALLGQHNGYIFGTEILSEGDPYKPLLSESIRVNNGPLAPIAVKTWHIVDATWPPGEGFSANRIGGVTTDGSRAYNGDLAEMLIYDHPLTDAERNLVGWYLAQKYGLQTGYVEP